MKKSIVINIPKSWGDFSLALRFLYVDLLSTKGEVSAAMGLVKKKLGRLKYHYLRWHGTEAIIHDIVSEFESIDDTEPIVPYLNINGRRLYFPKQHFEETPLMVFAKCDELYGYIRSAIEENDGTRAEKNMYQLLIALTAPSMNYMSYERYVSQKLTNREKRKLAKYIPVAMKYFIANKLYIYEEYGSLLFSGGGATKGIDLGWHGTAMSVAETGVIGNLSQVYQTYFHTVLLFLVKKKQDHENIKSNKK